MAAAVEVFYDAAGTFASPSWATLSVAMAAVDTVLHVNSAPFNNPSATAGTQMFRITVDAEQMLVTGTSGTTWTLTRGVGGTTAASHLINAVVLPVVAAASFNTGGRLGTTATQEVAVGGSLIGTRQKINLIQASDSLITAADNSSTQAVDVTIAAVSSTHEGPLNALEARVRCVGDGVTDNAAALARASALLQANGGDLYFPPGTYLTSAGIANLPGQTRVSGAGQRATSLRAKPGPSFIMLGTPDDGISRYGTTIENMTLDGNATNTTGNANLINLPGATEVTVQGMHLLFPRGKAIRWYGGSSTDGSVYGMFHDIKVRGAGVSSQGDAVVFDSGTSDGNMSQCDIGGFPNGVGLLVSGSAGTNFSQVNCWQCDIGFYIYGSLRSQLTNCLADWSDTFGFKIWGSSDLEFTGCSAHESSQQSAYWDGFRIEGDSSHHNSNLSFTGCRSWGTLATAGGGTKGWMPNYGMSVDDASFTDGLSIVGGSYRSNDAEGAVGSPFNAELLKVAKLRLVGTTGYGTVTQINEGPLCGSDPRVGMIPDGITDNNAAFGRASTMLQVSGGDFYIPPGVYYTSAGIPNIPGQTRVRGAGQRTTVVKARAGAAFTMFGTANDNLLRYNTTIQDLTIDGNGDNMSGGGSPLVGLYGAVGVVVQNISILNPRGTAIYMVGASGGGVSTNGIFRDLRLLGATVSSIYDGMFFDSNTSSATISGCDIGNFRSGRGLFIGGGHTNANVSQVTAWSCQTGFWLSQIKRIAMDHCMSEGSLRTGYQLYGVQELMMTGCLSHEAGQGGGTWNAINMDGNTGGDKCNDVALTGCRALGAATYWGLSITAANVCDGLTITGGSFRNCLGAGAVGPNIATVANLKIRGVGGMTDAG